MNFMNEGTSDTFLKTSKNEHFSSAFWTGLVFISL